MTDHANTMDAAQVLCPGPVDDYRFQQIGKSCKLHAARIVQSERTIELLGLRARHEVRDLTLAEDAQWTAAQTMLDDSRRDLHAAILNLTGLSADELREVL